MLTEERKRKRINRFAERFRHYEELAKTDEKYITNLEFWIKALEKAQNEHTT